MAARVDQRWQLVLGCLGATDAPFSQGALVKFRERMIAHDLDRKLLDRTVALAKQTGRFGWQALRAALDSSPLVGAGRVEDTWNLLGRALRTVVTCAATTLKIPRDAGAAGRGRDAAGRAESQSGAGYRLGRSGGAGRRAGAAAWPRSIAWRRGWRRTCRSPRRRPCRPRSPRCAACWRKTWSRTRPPGQRRIRRGVAADRMPSLGDPEMRHGRKTRTKPFTGYKRHVMKLVDADLIVGAVVRPANEPEHHALALLGARRRPAWAARRSADRSRLPGQSARRRRSPRRASRFARRRGPARIAAAFPSRPSRLIWRPPTSSVPPSSVAAIPLGATTVHFPAAVCQPCAQRAACTTATRGGRSIAIHPQEALLQDLAGAPTAPRRPRAPPRTHHRRALARPRRPDPRPQGALQRRAQEHARPATRRRHRQSPADRPAPEGRVTLRVQLSSGTSRARARPGRRGRSAPTARRPILRRYATRPPSVRKGSTGSPRRRGSPRRSRSSFQ